MLETSFLVFIPKTTTKALIATAVALIAIIVLRELAPWRKDEDDIVAYAGYWLVFFWLFALLAYDPLRALPGWVWGTPLTLLTIAFIAFAFKKGRDENAAAANPVLIESDIVLGDYQPDLLEMLPGIGRFTIEGVPPQNDAPTNDENLEEKPATLPDEHLEEKPAALPEGWEVIRDEEEGTEYYYCEATGVRQQERPDEEPTQKRRRRTRTQAVFLACTCLWPVTSGRM